MMDFYEMTMANGYFEDHDKDVQVAFDVFYRQNPDEGGFAIFAGLEQVIEYVENMTFTDEDVEYFRQQHMFSEKFLAYLKDFRFKGNIYALPEGTVMYPNEPILTVVAPLIDAQLVETAILAQINHQSLIATKAAPSRTSVRAAPTIWMRRRTARALPTSAALSARRRARLARCSASRSRARWRTAGSCSMATSTRRSRSTQ